MPVRISVNTPGKHFSLHCYENAGFEGDHFLITESTFPTIPDDEITSFQFDGEPGIRVELFDRDDFSTSQSWGEARLTRPNERVNCSHLNTSVGAYVFHRVGGGKLAGKVDSIRVSIG